MSQLSLAARLRPVLRCFPTLVVMSTVIVLALPPGVHAANFACGSGNVACLIGAINSANVDSAADTITLDDSIFTLDAVDNTTNGPNGLPSITSEITIEGTGAGAIIERGATAEARFRLFHVALTGNLTLNNVTVRNGWLPPSFLGETQGGGILNIGILVITSSTIADNRAGDDDSASDGFGGFGGGISNRNFALIGNSTIRGNRGGDSSGENADAGCGGGIFSADVILPGTTVRSFLGIVDSTIASNRAGAGGLTATRGGDGGGICAGLGAEVDIIGSTLTNNRAGKGLAAGDGGAVFVGSSSVVNIVNSTIFGNAAGGEPGDGTTLAGSGGAINLGNLNATVNITHSTIASNEAGLVALGSPFNGKGGAIAVNPRETDPNIVNVKSTIIYDNNLTFFGEQYSDCFAAVVGTLRFINDLGYNIDEGTSCAFSPTTNSQSSTDPRLVEGPPADNGGPTPTLALCTRAGAPHPACVGVSPALDAIPNGSNGCGSPIDVDQRGLPRPVDGNGDATAQCDIGAFEAGAGVCGDGMVDPGESCDDGNTANGDCCSSTCQLEPATTVCRQAAGTCDVAETCTGSSAACPANTFQPSGTVCGDSAAKACTSPDSCDGLGTCQANHKPDGTLCSDGSACTVNDACTAGTCGGHQVTCLGVNATICGTDGNDTLIGTDGPDVIAGRAGNDIIRGRGGDDVMCGGDGNDTVEGGDGNDRIDGGEGNDILRGQNGDDTIYGGGGNDTLEGAAGNDHLDGGPGTDRLRGGAGTDVCVNGEIVESCP